MQCADSALRTAPSSRTCGPGGGSPRPCNSAGSSCSRPSPDKTFLSFFVDFAGQSAADVSKVEGMTGPVQPVTAAGSADSFRVWQKDRPRVEQAIVEGDPFDAFVSERGRFDAMFDFMLRSGLWTAATEMRPAGLKKNNGISYRLLN